MDTKMDIAVPLRHQSQSGNTLLNSLPQKYYQQLQGLLTHTILHPGEMVLSQGRPMQYLYFPTTSVISRNLILKDGSSSAVAMIGREGLVGITQLIGGDIPTCNLVVLSAGHAFRIRRCQLQAEFDKGEVLQHLVLIFAQALITQIQQTTICSRHHTIEQQFCRWLLMSIDRVNSVDLHMTHEQIALNMGVRRESVSAAAHKLQVAGIIHYCRGHVSVVNRYKLENEACECYSIVQHEYTRLHKLANGATSRMSQQLHRH